ncbi:MAG TPA: (d)CMP kinase [Anaerolineae bacterium]|nr:(d)CMP kinase [Anaerolineae bacterium]
MTIAIDGPAASGKSTVGCLLAERLGYVYLDTGVMYRAVTCVALARGIPIEDEAAVTQLASTLRIDIERPSSADDGRQYTVLADGDDVTWEIRRPEVDHGVSPVSAYEGVRAALTIQQRRIGDQGGVVMVGRDIGTVVLPHADVKVYLDATLEERAGRRYREVIARGEAADFCTVLAQVRRRDEIDSSRALAPLRPAGDALILDTTPFQVEQVLERVLALVASRAGVAEVDAEEDGLSDVAGASATHHAGVA